ncbi:YidC/Oxa1 family insertase periplasmic-domain containing protein, partial [Escherichia coli]|uniref:YidC/Oxa1 family insertase periplasmic-domain containing protein n=3 Tax=Pseudomonadota TaxID=1224 RepID=UPI0013D6309B
GLKFVRTIAVDDRYMFTVADTVTNSGAAPVQIAPYGSVQRQGLSEEQSHAANVHEGAIGVVVDGSKTELQ